MEKIIRDIIEADREAREHIERVKEERYQIQSLIKEQGEKIKAAYQEKASAEIEACRQKLKESLNEQKKQSEEELSSSMTSLKKKFDSHKDEWIQMIVERCLAQ